MEIIKNNEEIKTSDETEVVTEQVEELTEGTEEMDQYDTTESRTVKIQEFNKYSVNIQENYQQVDEFEERFKNVINTETKQRLIRLLILFTVLPITEQRWTTTN